VNLWQWLIYRFKPVNGIIETRPGYVFESRGYSQYTIDRVMPKVRARIDAYERAREAGDE
jgi:hypothetical protein